MHSSLHNTLNNNYLCKSIVVLCFSNKKDECESFKLPIYVLKNHSAVSETSLNNLNKYV